MDSEFFLAALEKELGHRFTASQARAALLLSHFVVTPKPRPACILRGYAGTGKTSLVAALVKTMSRCGMPTVLLAPTGRAAKVFSRMAGAKASTIHRTIYRQETFRGEDTRFALGHNSLRGALFIVDEASMISSGTGFQNDSLFGSGELLDDLVTFVYSGDGCRLLLVGDTAQLPPVGEEESPALQDETFRRYGLLTGSADLTDVVRQQSRSSVVSEATLVRQCQEQNLTSAFPPIHTSETGEVRSLMQNDLIEQLQTDYDTVGIDETVVVVRSNKQAGIYNQGIRARILDFEDVLNRGDRVMVVKNNYFWAEQLAATLPKGETLPFSFIANGDVAVVERLRNVHTQHGFLFGEAVLRFPDYDDFELPARVLLSTLTSESPSLTAAESHELYERVLEDYAHIRDRRKRFRALREDPYYNALQLKYAYAVTCHKAQGGQWERVYVDAGFVPEMDRAFLRWFYTALTRTTERVYLVGGVPKK